MKKVICFIVPAVLAYIIGLFLLKLLLVDLIGLIHEINFDEFMDVFMLNFIACVTYYPIVFMKFLYQLIRIVIDKDYRDKIQTWDTVKSSDISDMAEKHFQNIRVAQSRNVKEAIKLREHYDELNAIKKIEKNTKNK